MTDEQKKKYLKGEQLGKYNSLLKAYAVKVGATHFDGFVYGAIQSTSIDTTTAIATSASGDKVVYSTENKLFYLLRNGKYYTDWYDSAKYYNGSAILADRLFISKDGYITNGEVSSIDGSAVVTIEELNGLDTTEKIVAKFGHEYGTAWVLWQGKPIGVLNIRTDYASDGKQSDAKPVSTSNAIIEILQTRLGITDEGGLDWTNYAAVASGSNADMFTYTRHYRVDGTGWSKWHRDIIGVDSELNTESYNPIANAIVASWIETLDERTSWVETLMGQFTDPSSYMGQGYYFVQTSDGLAMKYVRIGSSGYAETFPVDVRSVINKTYICNGKIYYPVADGESVWLYDVSSHIADYIASQQVTANALAELNEKAVATKEKTDEVYGDYYDFISGEYADTEVQVQDNTQNIASIQDSLDEIRTDYYENHVEAFEELSGQVDNNVSDISALKAKDTAIETSITNLRTEMNGVHESINTRIGALETTGLKRRIVDGLPSLSDAQENIIYMLPVRDEKGDYYNEYMYVASKSAYEIIGSSKTSLDGYTTRAQHNRILASTCGWEIFVDSKLGTYPIELQSFDVIKIVDIGKYDYDLSSISGVLGEDEEEVTFDNNGNLATEDGVIYTDSDTIKLQTSGSMHEGKILLFITNNATTNVGIETLTDDDIVTIFNG